jgi:hypothetical protein
MYHHVRYASSYLVPGVSLPKGPSFHRIALHWDLDEPEGEGSCHLDPNACGLDEFGDTTMCTKMAVAPLEMRLVPGKRKPGHHAYAVECRHAGEASYTALAMRVVTIAHGHEPLQCRLLILDAAHAVERILELRREPRT